jgi:APA family basic amino acid/polyamine antiporter
MATHEQVVGDAVYVRQATGLVRQASVLDAVIYNAAVSAPVGAILAWSIFFILSLFPGADLVVACGVALVLNGPILVMMALMAAAIPKTGGDYVWVSRILGPRLALVSNFAAAFAGLMGATFFARYFSVFALGPVLSTLGIVFHSNGLLTWGTRFQTEKLWIFLGGLSMVLLVGAVMLAGTKATFRWQNTFFVIASVGTFVAFVVLLVGSPGDFRHHFNALSTHYGAHPDAYDGILRSTQGKVASSPQPGKLSSLIPTVFVVMSFAMWNWWSIYTGGELRSARNRSRQLWIMFGALVWDVVLIAVGVLLIYKVAGYHFMSAVNAGSPEYKLPAAPWYHLLVALVFDKPVLTLLIVGSFVFWSLPSMIANLFVPIRTMFAWGFDRLLPEVFTYVSPRRGAPVVGIAVSLVIVTALLLWSVFAATFQTLIGFTLLAGTVTVATVSVAAFLMPIRRPELYRSSPADVRFAGLPLLQIVAPLALAIMAFLVWATVKYPPLAIGTASHRWWIPVYLAALALVAVAIYEVAARLQARRGVDVSMVFAELPPD